MSGGGDSAEDTIRQIAEQARTCTKSPTAPDERGWSVPDWRDASAYPTADEFDDSEWRWEFLRRRHGFRADWLRPAAEFLPATRERYFLEVYDVDRPCDPRVSIRDVATGITANARRGNASIRFPTSGLAPFRGTLLSQTIGDLRFLARIIPEHPGPDDIFARFDIGRPLKRQIEQAAHYLQRLRDEAYGKDADARTRRNLWDAYLRLLDASDAGASYAEMANILPYADKSPHAARDALHAAERLRQEWRY
jgi:hypothetical protein